MRFEFFSLHKFKFKNIFIQAKLDQYYARLPDAEYREIVLQDIPSPIKALSHKWVEC